MFGKLVGGGCRRENLGQKVGQLTPFRVVAASAHGKRERLKALKRLDFGFQLSDGSRGGRLVENLFLGGFDLVIGRVLQILHILGIKRRRCCRHDGCRRRSSLQQFQLAHSAFKALPPAAQRLCDGLRGGGEPPLEDCQRKSDRAGTLVVLKRVGAVELLAHIFGDFLVEARLGLGELVRHGVSYPFRE